MLTTIILGGGKGTRMKSDLPKVLNKIKDKTLIQRVIELAERLNSDQIVVVVGYKKELVINHLGDKYDFAVQEEQKGTGHAVSVAEDIVKDNHEMVLVLNGDAPLLDINDLRDMINFHREGGAAATVLTAELPNPFAYGRIIRNESGVVEAIVEEKDANDEQKKIHEINTGTFCFDKALLFHYLKEVRNNNSQNEYYLTDLVHILNKAGEKVIASKAKNWKTTLGANTIEELKFAEKILEEV